jgi:3-hydroxyisobutyrate dehydrogenase-like beta-hydroxyacid dehydrogenase
MGMPMVERISAAGFPLSVFVRRPEVAERLAAQGIGVAASARDAAAASDVVIVCTFSDAQLREVVFGDQQHGGVLAALPPGAVLVNHVTGSPTLALEMAGSAPPGAAVVDAPVSGTPEQIRAGELTILAGAAPDALEKVRPVLATYASTILHVGAVGDAQRLKLLNNLVFTAHLRIAVLASELANSMGISDAALAGALVHCSGTSLPISMLDRLPATTLAAGARPFLAKDVAVIRDVAAGMGLDLGPLGSLAGWVTDGDPSAPLDTD